MFSSVKRPQWRRIYRQTITLIYKNLLIFYTAPFSTLCRALLFPVAVALIFSFLKYINTSGSSYIDTSNYGIANSSTPVKGIGEAIALSSSPKLVFVRNGISNDTLGPIIEGVLDAPGMQDIESYSIDDPNDLFDLCRQSIQGYSDCFAAVIFTSSNDTNVEYIIALDGSVSNAYGYGDWKTGETVLTQRIFPLQWAISSQIGNFSNLPKPSTQGFAGDFGPQAYQSQGSNKPEAATQGPRWLSLVAYVIAPVFVLIPIGVVYHLNIFVATERETSMAELMTAQHVTAVPRILSILLSFYALYFPGFLACSIILTQVLFVKTSDILFLFITLLAGASFVAASHFVASFFGKAQLAGLYSSTLFFALSLVTLAASLSSEDNFGERLGLSLIFPPAAWANFIGDVAYREFNLKAFSLAPEPWIPSQEPQYFPPTQIQYLNGYLYIICFIVQIVAYSLGTYVIERKLWGVTRKFDLIDSTSDVALRCTSLSKTYYGKRRWYWPFNRKGGPVLAIDSLDLEVKKGSVTFLLGPNGGGKTTTLKCVAGMTSMDTGSRLELNEAGLVFGICPQSNVCLPTPKLSPQTYHFRSSGRTSQSNSTLKFGGNSRRLLLTIRPWTMTMFS
jgi:ATP-binding cassette subfamily A (ABC1) protein 3